MTKQRMLGVLLIVLAVLTPLLLWMLGVTLIEFAPGPQTTLRTKTGTSESVVSEGVVSLGLNGFAFLPSLLLVAAGIACLVIPSRRRVR